MKTIMELLVRLAELKKCEQRLSDRGQITNREKAAAECLQGLIRESLPGQLLPVFDRMFETEPLLLESPEVFAMAVIVATYRAVSPTTRKKLLTFFAIPKRAKSSALSPRQVGSRGNSPFPRSRSRVITA